MKEIEFSSDNNTQSVDKDVDELFEQKLKNYQINNNRKTIRFSRTDFTSQLMLKNLMGIEELLNIEVIDISTKGAMIQCAKKLTANKKIQLVLSFTDGTSFKIPGKIIRKKSTPPPNYGVKFDQQENDLGDYLLATAKNFDIK